MDKQELQQRLNAALDAQRHHSFDYWKERIGEDPLVIEGVSAEGKKFIIEIDPVWDGPASGEIRVLCSIDYGGVSSFSPPTADFIIRPDGTFVE